MNESLSRPGAGSPGDAPREKGTPTLNGVVVSKLPNAMFRVELPGGRTVTGHLAGNARALLTRLVPGDQVHVELSPLDAGLCRIVGRPRDARGR